MTTWQPWFMHLHQRSLRKSSKTGSRRFASKIATRASREIKNTERKCRATHAKNAWKSRTFVTQRFLFGVLGPLGIGNKIFRDPKCLISSVRICVLQFLEVLSFSKTTEVYKSLQVLKRTLPSLSIAVNVTDLTI